MFLPVVVETDEKGLFAGFTNEATFAANFSQEMGILTNDTLQDYQNFQTAGSVFKKSIVEDFGGFKPSVKLTFIYEFLLRLTYNSVLIMTVPRLGYKHVNLREGSIFWNYKFGENKMIEDEVKFWIQAAKREYFFTQSMARSEVLKLFSQSFSILDVEHPNQKGLTMRTFESLGLGKKLIN